MHARTHTTHIFGILYNLVVDDNPPSSFVRASRKLNHLSNPETVKSNSQILYF